MELRDKNIEGNQTIILKMKKFSKPNLKKNSMESLTNRHSKGEEYGVKSWRPVDKVEH